MLQVPVGSGGETRRTFGDQLLFVLCSGDLCQGQDDLLVGTTSPLVIARMLAPQMRASLPLEREWNIHEIHTYSSCSTHDPTRGAVPRPGACCRHALLVGCIMRPCLLLPSLRASKLKELAAADYGDVHLDGQTFGVHLDG